MTVARRQAQGEYVRRIGPGGVFPSVDLQRRYEWVVMRLAQEPQRYFDAPEPPAFVPVMSLRRPTSELVKCCVRSPRGSLGLYMKFFLVRGTSQEAHDRAMQRINKEVEVTNRLYTQLGQNSAYAVPRVIAFFPEERAVVMEESEGQRLLELIMNKGRGYPAQPVLEELAQYCHALGRWLRNFQQLTYRPESEKLHRTDFIHYVSLRLSRLEKSEIFSRKGVSEKILFHLEKLLQQTKESDMDTCGVHGDLSLSNILVTSKKVTVLDFSMYYIDSIYNDPSYFCSKIDSIYKKSIKYSTISYVKKAFLEGYQENFDVDHPLFIAYYMRHKINRLLSLRNIHNLSVIKKFYQVFQYRQCWNDVCRLTELLQNGTNNI